MTDKLLNGELRGDLRDVNTYHVYEKNGGFKNDGKHSMRHSEIWRDTVTKGQNAQVIKSEKLNAHRVRAMYEPNL